MSKRTLKKGEYHPKSHFHGGRRLNWSDDISAEQMRAMEQGEIFCLYGRDDERHSYVMMDSYGEIREQRIPKETGGIKMQKLAEAVTEAAEMNDPEVFKKLEDAGAKWAAHCLKHMRGKLLRKALKISTSIADFSATLEKLNKEAT